MLKRRTLLTALAVAVLGSLAFMRAQDAGDPVAAEAFAATNTVQPIAFPHIVHAGTDQIPCMYCHFSAERSVDAGIPPVRTCMGCHQIIPGTTEAQQAEIDKVKGYWDRQEAIPWVRIYKVADHVHFPHMRHIAAAVDCATCHGVVEEIGVIEEVNQPLAMGWCVTCHREREASTDCSTCHY